MGAGNVDVPARHRHPASRRRPDRGCGDRVGRRARVAARAQPGRGAAAPVGALRRRALMRRSSAARLFAEHLAPDDIVVCGLGSTARAWREQKDPRLTYYASDPMGLGPAPALGLALARPDPRIVL